MTDSSFKTPRCLSFLDKPPFGKGDTHVTLAEIRSIQENGLRGTSRIYTILVPTAKLARTLRLKHYMGWIVELSDVADDDGDFRVRRSRGSAEGFEPLVFGWVTHNRTVLTPNPKWLASLGLVTSVRNIDLPRIEWDDLEGPTYSVVEVVPVSKYEGPDDVSGAHVKILRKYAERLAADRCSAIVEIFYEHRSLAHDAELDALLGDRKELFFELPGRSTEIKRTHERDYPYFVAAWGLRLVLKPKKRLAAFDNEPKPALTWPGFRGVINDNRAFFHHMTDRVYVSDEVLEGYQDRDEFDVDPTNGSIGYEGRWALSYCNRVGRDYFAYELKKIYEGCPPDVIRHVHQFAVEPEIAVKQRRLLGHENIGTRATKLIAAFYSLVAAIKAVAASVGLDLTEEKIATPTGRLVEYHGWWTMTELKSLGYRAPQAMSRDDFLRRCVVVAKLVERLKQSTLRQIVTTIGITSKEVKGRKTIALLGVLAVLGHLARESGLRLSDDAGELASRWNPEDRVGAVKVLFVGRELRDLASHATESSAQLKVDQNVNDLGIDPKAHRTGWGTAVDQLYDVTTVALEEIAQLLRDAC